MMRPVSLVVGIGLLAAAALLKFVVVPSQAQFPADVDTTSTYEGTLAVMLDVDALARGDLPGLFVRDVPVTITNHTEVVDTEGELALVQTDGQVTDPDGTVLRTSENLYAIDRVSMLTVADAPWQDVPERDPGLVTGFPIGTESRDYEGWSDEIGDLVALRYERSEERAGVDTHVFSNTVTNQVVVDEDTLATVPEALPKDLVVQLAGTLDLPAALAEQLDALVPLLPDPVPLGLVFSGQTTYWVDPTTGVVIDLERTESRAAYLDVPVIPVVVPVVDVWAWSYAPTDATVAEAVETAQDEGGRLRLFGTTLPIVALVLGLAALAFGLIRRPEHEHDTPHDPVPVDRAHADA